MFKYKCHSIEVAQSPRNTSLYSQNLRCLGSFLRSWLFPTNRQRSVHYDPKCSQFADPHSQVFASLFLLFLYIFKWRIKILHSTVAIYEIYIFLISSPLHLSRVFNEPMDHFWVAPSLWFYQRGWVQSHWHKNVIIIFMQINLNFHKKGFALCFVLKVRVIGTRKWPVTKTV